MNFGLMFNIARIGKAYLDYFFVPALYLTMAVSCYLYPQEPSVVTGGEAVLRAVVSVLLILAAISTGMNLGRYLADRKIRKENEKYL